MMRPAASFLVGQDSTLREAFERIQRGACGIALLVESSGRLVRTVTDGDLRRLILEGAELSSRMSRLPAHTSVIAGADVEPARALEILNEHKIDHLPVVDAQGCPVGVYFRRDIDAQILLSTPHMGSLEREYVDEAFRTNWIAPLGPNVDAFERELAAYAGVRHAAAVVSGTAALHLSLRLVGVERGDRVFCSSLTFVASANPILYQGAVPVFIDSEPTSWNMSPNALERALEDAARRRQLPKAVIVVNLYGQSADMNPLLDLCSHYSIPIIEDAAESLGATYRGRKSGTIGRIGAYSFNGNKIITTSGGGMLVSNDEDLIRYARKLSTQAREPVAHYEHVEVGYNYRMSNVLAGIGRGQLRVIDDRVRARRRIFARYAEALADLPAIRWMPEAAFGICTRWLTAATLQDPLRPEDLIRALAAERIEARRLWKPMHLQPLFAGAEYFSHSPGCDVSASLFQQGICLPSGSNMTDEQQDRIIDSIRKLLA